MAGTIGKDVDLDNQYGIDASEGGVQYRLFMPDTPAPVSRKDDSLNEDDLVLFS